MRRTAPRAAAAVAFVALAALALSAGAEGAKRPVTGQGPESPPPPVAEPAKTAEPAAKPPPPVAEPAAAAEAPAAPAAKDENAGGRAPVGEKAPPPAPVGAPAAEVKAPTPAAPPPAPAVFKGERAPAAAPAAPRPVDPDPPVLRYSKKSGDVLYGMSVRPGKPKPGAPVEIVFAIHQLLPIPDPVLGDRRPVEKGKFVARVTTTDGAVAYELHPMADKGEYGFHFTPVKEGVHTVAVARVGGRSDVRIDFPLGVGVPTPIPTDDASDPLLRRGAAAARRVVGTGAAPAADDGSATVMDELGKTWLELRRQAGTPEAAAALNRVIELSKKLAGKVPAGYPEARADFDRLATRLVSDLEAAGGAVADPARATAELDRLQGGTCLRCHTQFRFGLAGSVDRWPDFEKRNTPPAPVKK